MKKLLAIALLTGGFALIYNAITDLDGKNELSSNDRPGSHLTTQIKTDLIYLATKHELPREWSSIREKKAMTTSPITEQWLNEARVDVPINPLGRYRLEYILIAEDPDTQNSRLMIQYGLYDIQSENKIWEKIRIYDR